MARRTASSASSEKRTMSASALNPLSRMTSGATRLFGAQRPTLDEVGEDAVGTATPWEHGDRASSAPAPAKSVGEFDTEEERALAAEVRAAVLSEPTPQRAHSVIWTQLRGCPILRDGRGNGWAFEGGFNHDGPVFVASFTSATVLKTTLRAWRTGQTWNASAEVAKVEPRRRSSLHREHGEERVSQSTYRAYHLDEGDPNLPPLGPAWFDGFTGEPAPKWLRFRLDGKFESRLSRLYKEEEDEQRQVVAIGTPTQLLRRARTAGVLLPLAVREFCTVARIQLRGGIGCAKDPVPVWLNALTRLPTSYVSPTVDNAVEDVLERQCSETSTNEDHAATQLKSHLEAVLCAPLQQLVDGVLSSTPRAVERLSSITAAFADPDWWFTAAVVDPVTRLYSKRLMQEVQSADLNRLNLIAEQQLADDRRIYSAIHEKEKKKQGYVELSDDLAVLEAKVHAANHGLKPQQPTRTIGEALSVAKSKAQAANVHAAFREVVEEVATSTGAEAHIPNMKSGFRMLQKSIRSGKRFGASRVIGDCRAICDVNRALLQALDPAHVRSIISLLTHHRRVQVCWVKDRINHPTGGGWCDALILFRIVGTNRHICEIQVAFQSMVAARAAGRGHAAYALARDAIETIEAAGGTFVSEVSNPAERLQVTVDRLTVQNAALLKENARLLEIEKENSLLRQTIARLTAAVTSQSSSRRSSVATDDDLLPSENCGETAAS